MKIEHVAMYAKDLEAAARQSRSQRSRFRLAILKGR